MAKRQFGKKRIIIASIVAISALAIVGTIAYSRDYAFFSNSCDNGAHTCGITSLNIHI